MAIANSQFSILNSQLNVVLLQPQIKRRGARVVEEARLESV